MANLKDIRSRIQSIKNTAKITQAMRMVAAAKVKRAEVRIRAARPYSEALSRIVASLLSRLDSLNENALEGSRYAPLLIGGDTSKVVKTTGAKTIGMVVISSDRGLCGAYNANVIRQALKLERELAGQGIAVQWYPVGTKAAQALKRYSDAPVLGTLTGMTAAPSAADAAQVAQTLLEALENGTVDRLEALSTYFRSMLSYKVELTRLLPMAPTEVSSASETAVATSVGSINKPVLLEPDAAGLIDQLVPDYLGQTLYRLMLEASASELAARMTAMSNASNNAKDIIGKLTISYNKARQAAITQEILEVVGGAEALA